VFISNGQQEISRMIRAIIIDIGGVLIRTSSRESRLAWEHRLGLAEWESEEIVFESEVGTKAQLGKISDEELWAQVGSRLDLSGADLEEFRRDFWAGDRVDESLYSFVRSLRPRYQTAVISNATDSLRRRLKQEYGIAEGFDLIVVSAEEGVMKPDPVIYQRALDRLGRSPEETIFIDDSRENVAAAQDGGMVGIHFSAELDIARELAIYGVTAPQG
jgi:HAD superfamily hydrolase (TIGR01509 family)